MEYERWICDISGSDERGFEHYNRPLSIYDIGNNRQLARDKETGRIVSVFNGTYRLMLVENYLGGIFNHGKQQKKD